MRILKISLYLAFSMGPTLICINLLGLSSTLAILFVILVHELGHATVWMMAGNRPLILVTPFFGFCMPLDHESDVLPFNAYGTSLLYLAGPLFNIIFLGMLSFACRCLPGLARIEVVTDLSVFSGIVILLNLLLPCPFLDGWRILFFAFAGPVFWTRLLLWTLSLLSMWMLWPVDRYVAGSIGIVLVLLGRSVVDSAVAEKICGPLMLHERTVMVLAWLMCVLMAIGVICLHPHGLRILIKLIYR